MQVLSLLLSDGILSSTFAGCLSRPSAQQMDQHEETNSDFNDDDLYVYDDSEEDYEDEVSELDGASFRARFVSKDRSETKVERGRTATLECAVDRLVLKTSLYSAREMQIESECL